MFFFFGCSCCMVSLRCNHVSTQRPAEPKHRHPINSLPPASFNAARAYLSMDFATEEQAARTKVQMVNLKHRWLHIESYEIFTEEMDGNEGEWWGESGRGYQSHGQQRAHTSEIAFFDRAGLNLCIFSLQISCCCLLLHILIQWCCSVGRLHHRVSAISSRPARSNRHCIEPLASICISAASLSASNACFALSFL